MIAAENVPITFRMKPKKVETLGDLRDHEMGLYAHCLAPSVGHGGPLDLGSLIEVLGEDYVFINDKRIGAACVCRKCGHQGAGITVVSSIG